MKINYTKTIPGDEDTEAVVDPLINCLPVAAARAAWILGRRGKRWSVATVQIPGATLQRGQTVDLEIDGQLRRGYVHESPSLSYRVSQGTVELVATATILLDNSAQSRQS